MLIHDLSSLHPFVPPSSRLSPRDPNIANFVSCPSSCLCLHSYYRVYARPRCLSLSRAPSPLPSPVETRGSVQRFPSSFVDVSHLSSLVSPLTFPVIFPVTITFRPYHHRLYRPLTDPHIELSRTHSRERKWREQGER